jgi:uncharacterized metal-binding protein YceD (DUF177 family)
VNTHNTYAIPLRGLKIGVCRFDFKLDDAFFQIIEGSEIQHGSVSVDAEVERYNNMMIINFYLQGEVEVACDRCLDLFYIPVEADAVLSVRFSNLMPDNQEYLAEDSEEDIIFVDPSDEMLDVAHYLYESVCLSLPIQRIHSDDENGNSLCDPDVIKYLRQHEVN